MQHLGSTLFLSAVFAIPVISSVGCRTEESIRDRLKYVSAALEKHPAEDAEQAPINAEASIASLPEGILSIDEARDIAMRHNPDVDAALARLQAALGRLAEARSRYLPTMNVTHNSTRTFLVPASRNRLATAILPTQAIATDISSPDFPLTTLLNALARPLLGSRNPTGVSSSFSEHSTSVTATWVVFDGFVRDAQNLAAKAAYRASEASLGDIQRLIVQAVDSAYYQVQLAEEQIRIAAADEEFSRKQYEETRKLMEAGRASQADVDNFRVRMLDAQTNLQIATGQRETGRVVLAELLGLPEATLPGYVTLAELQNETNAEMEAPEADRWIATASSGRPDLNELSHLVENARQLVKAAEGRYLPTVTMSGSWGYDRPSNIHYGSDDQSSAAGIEVRWDLFTGGARKARVRIAASELIEAESILRRLRLAVTSAVRQAVINVVNAQERIVLQRESLDTALENRRVVQLGYVAGKETLNRLNETQRDVVAAQANLASARIELRQAWTDLRAAAAGTP